MKYTIEATCPQCNKTQTLIVSTWAHHNWIFWPTRPYGCCTNLITWRDPEDINTKTSLDSAEQNNLLEKYIRRLNKNAKT